MFRPLLALALLALALPAQQRLGPSDVWLYEGRADVFAAGGRVYVILWNISGSVTWEHYAPRIGYTQPVKLISRGACAYDPRPCARGYPTPTSIAINDDVQPVPGWTLDSAGNLLTFDPRHSFAAWQRTPFDPERYTLHYFDWSPKSPCNPLGAPALLAVMFEVVLL